MVARTAPFGAFVTVTLEDGATADGLVHVSKIKDGQREMLRTGTWHKAATMKGGRML